MSFPFTGPSWQITNAAGVPVSNARIFTYEAGTTSPKAAYTTAALTVPHANPAICDSSGKIVMFFGAGAYRVEVQDAAGVVLSAYSADNLSSTNAADIFFSPPTGMTSTDVQSAIVEVSASGASLEGRIANKTSPLQGSALVGFVPTLGYPYGSNGYYVAKLMRTWFWGQLTQAQLEDVLAATQTVDMSPLISNFLAYSGGPKYFPRGTYRMDSGVTWNTSNVGIIGDGEQATIFNATFATGDVFCIGDGSANPNNCYVKGCTITTSVTRTSGAYVRTRNAHSTTFSQLRLEGAIKYGVIVDGGAQQYLTTLRDLEINAGLNAIILGFDGTYPQETFFHGTINLANTTGPAILLTNCGGTYIPGVISTINCQSALLTYPSVGQTVEALTFTGRLLADTTSDDGIKLITNGGTLSDVTMVAPWASSCGTATSKNGITIDPGTGQIRGVKLLAPEISNCGGHGILISGGTDIYITSPQINANSATSANVSSGIKVAANVSQWGVSGGTIGLAGYYGSNPQKYGIEVASGTSDYYSIVGVNVTGNTTTGIADGGSGSNKMVKANIGYNPFAGGSITVTASPFTFGNVVGDSVVVFITGGTVSNISLDSKNVAAATNTSILVPQGSLLVVTYTVAPTMTYKGT